MEHVRLGNHGFRLTSFGGRPFQRPPYLVAMGTRVLCMKTIFQTPACFSRKADSSQLRFTVPEASVMLPL
jgi:hypothetical protein